MKTKRTITQLALAITCAFAMSACAGQMRSVTHISTWSTEGGDYFYLAYAESQTVSRVKLCRVAQDNTIACSEQPEVDRLLNVD